MSSQFGIYATAADMIAIEHLVRSADEPFVIFENTITNSAPIMLPDFSSSQSLSFRIARKADFDNVQWRPLPDGSRYVDIVSSPAIEVIRPFFDGNQMSRGRFYHISSYFDEHGRKVSKPEDFLTWAKSVSRVVKRGLFLEKNVPLPTYVGPQAKEWMDGNAGFHVTPNCRIILKPLP